MEQHCEMCKQARDEMYRRRPNKAVMYFLGPMIAACFIAMASLAFPGAVATHPVEGVGPLTWRVCLMLSSTAVFVTLVILVRMFWRTVLQNPDWYHSIDANGQPHAHLTPPVSYTVLPGAVQEYRDASGLPIRHQLVIVQPIRYESVMSWRGTVRRSAACKLDHVSARGSGEETTIEIGGQSLTCKPCVAIELLALQLTHKPLVDQIRSDKADLAAARSLAGDLLALDLYFQAVPLNSHWAQGGQRRLRTIINLSALSPQTIWSQVSLTEEEKAARNKQLESYLPEDDVTRGAYELFQKRQLRHRLKHGLTMPTAVTEQAESA